MNVLGIETSCDETSAAVVRDGYAVCSNIVFSQVRDHAPYGGVVPEIAARRHVELLPSVITQAIAQSGLGWADMDAIAVTFGPGLATSLLVGLAAAKGLALRLDRPLIGVHHLEAHILSAFLGAGAPRVETVCPFTALVVSGGHTCLMRVEQLGRYRLLGRTVDDAAGEAFDKGANLLGLGYPGGPAIDKASRGGNPAAVRFPRGIQRKAVPRIAGLDPDLCFSFSGLKTALLYHLRSHPLPADSTTALADVTASYQEAIVDALLDRVETCLGGTKHFAIIGGVSLNRRLREKARRLANTYGVQLLLAEPQFCADNAAMVAGLAGAGQGRRGNAVLFLDAEPNAEIG